MLHVGSTIPRKRIDVLLRAFARVRAEVPDARLVRCIDAVYPAVTGLAQHADTITHNMTEYHAFRKVAPTTPAAILELGFLGGDRDLLTNNAEVAARGVADSIRCFLEDAEPTPAPTETTSN